MKTKRHNMTRLFALTIILLAATTAAQAQSSDFEGDFSPMSVGTVRLVRIRTTGSLLRNTDDIFYVTAKVDGDLTGALGFSFYQNNNDFAPEFVARVTVDGFGNGYSEYFYMKAFATVTSPIQIKACGAPQSGTCAQAAINPPSAPNPGVNPPPTVKAVAVNDIVAFWLVTPAPVAEAHRNSTITFTVTPNEWVGVAKSATSGTWGASIAVDMTFDSQGHGRTPTFYLKGRKPKSSTSIRAVSDNWTAVGHQDITMKVCHIASFEWMPYDGSHPLDANPNPFGGTRIFSDKNNPNESDTEAAYRKVRLRVKLNASVAGLNVRVKVFDVEDGSSDFTRRPYGNDNLSGVLGQTVNLITDSNGEAAFTFTVSSQPGDNYRAAAVLSSLPITAGTEARELIDRTEIDKTGLRTLYGDLITPPFATSHTETIVASQMLTVWRRLHIERDSMGSVTGNWAQGSFLRAQQFPRDNYTIFDLDSSSTRLDYKRFEKGKLYFQSPRNAAPQLFNVISNTDTGVKVAPQVSSGLDFGNDMFTLYDDDDFNRSKATWWLFSNDGDEGEDVPMPDTGLLQDSDDPDKNVLAPAYVRPKYDLAGEEDNLPFVLNSYRDRTRFNNIGSEANPDFWTIYLLNAYQPPAASDGDPDSESSFSLAWGFSEGAATFYAETHTDYENYRAANGNPLPLNQSKKGLVAAFVVSFFDPGATSFELATQVPCIRQQCLYLSNEQIGRVRSSLNP